MRCSLPQNWIYAYEETDTAGHTGQSTDRSAAGTNALARGRSSRVFCSLKTTLLLSLAARALPCSRAVSALFCLSGRVRFFISVDPGLWRTAPHAVVISEAVR